MVKRCKAALLGMPPWNIEELTKGYVSCLTPFPPSIPAISFDRGPSLTALHLCGLSLEPDYSSLRSKLEQSLSAPDESTPPVVGNRIARAALKALQGRRNHDEMGNVIGAVIDRDENMVDEAAHLQDKVDNAIKTLVHNTTGEFGFAPVMSTMPSLIILA